MAGALISTELGGQIQDTIRTVRGGKRRSVENVPSIPLRTASAFPELAVILDAALAAVTNPKEPTSALARIQRWSVADGEYTETQTQIRVYNHSFTAYAVNTFGMAKVVDGHHWFFGDCTAMSSGLRTALETPP